MNRTRHYSDKHYLFNNLKALKISDVDYFSKKVYLHQVHLIQVQIIQVHLIQVHLIQVHLIQVLLLGSSVISTFENSTREKLEKDLAVGVQVQGSEVISVCNAVLLNLNLNACSIYTNCSGHSCQYLSQLHKNSTPYYSSKDNQKWQKNQISKIDNFFL